MKKILPLLLSACLLICMLSGCSVSSLVNRVVNKFSPRVDLPQGLSYSLDNEMVEQFYTAMENAKKAAMETDEQAAEAAFSALDEAYMDIYDQNQIAYLYYCLDLSNSQYSSQYVNSTQILSQAEADYNAVAKELYLMELPLHKALFGDWPEERIQNMLCYNDRVQQINDRTTQIVVAYRELSEDSFAQDMIPLYNELVKLNNELAQIYGYSNYYEFAHDMVYERDYDLNHLEKMRTLVAKYLPELCEKGTEYFETRYEQFDRKQRELFYSFSSGNNYQHSTSKYVKEYISSMPQQAQEDMNCMLDGSSVFTTSDTAYAGAFTLDISGLPFCYFGPSYADNTTVIHEMGHYYASMESDTWPIPMDLAETHSQGNEYLFTQFASTVVEGDIYDVISAYKLVNDIGMTVLYTMVDEFEYQVYTNEDAGNMSLAQYEELMEQVAERYGGIEKLSQTIGDIQSYWKYVVIESPVYYVSYAVSGLAAMDLFLQAEVDSQQARENYCCLIEQAETDQGFLACIRQAGMYSPFEEELYQRLQNRFGK